MKVEEAEVKLRSGKNEVVVGSGLRGESKYDFRTVSVQWTLRGGGGQVLDAKDCYCNFS